MSGAVMQLDQPLLESERGSGLVVVSLQCTEAIAFAADILPATAATYDRSRFYLLKGELPAEAFEDPVDGKALVQIADASAEFLNIGAPEVAADVLLRAVARLAAFCLADRYCEELICGDDESLSAALDDVADARVTERIIVWASGLCVREAE